MRRAPTIKLDIPVRKELERLSRSRSVAVRLAERSRIVLLAAGGLDNQEIAAKLDITRQKATGEISRQHPTLMKRRWRNSWRTRPQSPVRARSPMRNVHRARFIKMFSSTGIFRPTDPYHLRQLRHAQTSESRQLVEAQHALSCALHTDQCILAEHGRTLLPGSFRTTASARGFPFGS